MMLRDIFIDVASTPPLRGGECRLSPKVFPYLTFDHRRGAVEAVARLCVRLLLAVSRRDPRAGLLSGLLCDPYELPCARSDFPPS